ncbi:MAG TPA: organomercurial lyase, partial [Actinomycetes bacterium]|nr:organomercurial lyase [Actinomycetes bacterium]
MPRLSHHDEHTTRAPVEVCECCEDTASRAQRAARMAVPARALHRAILQAFAGSARPPRYAELEQAARAVGLDPATALAGLAEQDVVVLGPGGVVRAAYPFSAAPTPHRVALADGPTVYAMCAVDALG